MGFFDLIFPKFCAGCRRWGTYLCPECIKNLGQSEPVCPVCERRAIGGAAHPLCRKRYGLDGLWSLGAYKDPLRKVIQKLKYHFVRETAAVLVDLMVEYWARHSPRFLEEIKREGGAGWIIVPVPLHPKRQNWRGFNQSALLGQLLSKKIGLDYQEALERIRYTKSQVELSGRGRRQNIQGAFAVNLKFKVENLKFLLIDDVWTTGSTLRECAYVLKRGGAKKVWAITLAR